MSKSTPEAILAKAQSSRTVIQDFIPLASSLEWNLGQEYLRQRGNKAFLSDASPVPFVINNDGTLSRNAAEVFFASLVDAEKNAPLTPDPSPRSTGERGEEFLVDGTQGARSTATLGYPAPSGQRSRGPGRSCLGRASDFALPAATRHPSPLLAIGRVAAE